jgi:hypothetical protein
MRVIENTYSRRFNRLRRRDGPLVRARFFSKPVRTEGYRFAVVRYIDRNPVRARIVLRPEDYEFGSARGHMFGVGQPWLERRWVASVLRWPRGQGQGLPEAYREAFGCNDPARAQALDSLVEQRMHSGSLLDPLDDLIGAKPAAIRAWLAAKARLADGQRINLPVCTPQVLRRVLTLDAKERGPWYVEDRSDVLRGHALAQVALLRELCGATWPDIARAVQVPLGRARSLRSTHDRLVSSSRAYADRVSGIAKQAMEATLGRESAVRRG